MFSFVFSIPHQIFWDCRPLMVSLLGILGDGLKAPTRKAFFPDILESAVQNAVFVEHGPKLGTSPLGNAVANRDLILDRAMEAREVYHRVFKSKSVEKIIQKGWEDAMKMWKHMGFNGHHVRQIEPEELGALLNFFNKVIERKAWIEMTPATTSCSEFCQAWNKISLAVRDQVAVKVAESVKHQVEESCNKSWTEKIRCYCVVLWVWVKI